MKRKNVLALVLGTVMLSIAGMGTTALAEESDLNPVTFVRSQDSTMESDIFAKMEGATYDDNIWTDLIAERLGYDVQYLWIASDGDLYNQKFNAAIATGELPDIVCVDKTNLKNLVEADLLLDLTPYFEEYASDYVKELIAAGGNAGIQAGTYDGIWYGLPYVDCDIETAQLLWLRTDWLKELGLTAPSTLDELKEILKAFNEYAGEGATGLSICNDIYGNFMDIKGWCNAYGAFPKYWIETEEGTLEYGSTTEEMKNALSGLAELYAEGLIDPEFYVNDAEKTKQALVNGKCGALYGYHAASLYPLQDVLEADPEADWMPYMIPMLSSDETTTVGINMCTASWYAVSKECEHPEALIELLNLYCEKVLDPELNEYAVYGNPGNGLEGVWRLSPVTINSPNKNQVTTKAISDALETGDPGDLSGEQYSMWEYSYAAKNGDTTLWGWNRVFGKDGAQEILMEYQESENVALVYDEFVSAPGEIMSTRKTTLDDMLDQVFIKIIAGQESLDSFDSVVAEWKAAGGDAMTAEVNEWYTANK